MIGQGITGEVYEAMNINTAEMFVVKNGSIADLCQRYGRLGETICK